VLQTTLLWRDIRDDWPSIMAAARRHERYKQDRAEGAGSAQLIGYTVRIQ